MGRDSVSAIAVTYQLVALVFVFSRGVDFWSLVGKIFHIRVSQMVFLSGNHHVVLPCLSGNGKVTIIDLKNGERVLRLIGTPSSLFDVFHFQKGFFRFVAAE